MNPYTHIFNPKTGGKVKINSKLGRETLRNYLNIMIGGAGGATPAAAVWWENIPNNPLFRRSIRGSNGRNYQLIFFHGRNYINPTQGGPYTAAQTAAHAIYGIVNSNQNEFNAQNWTFAADNEYLSVTARRRTIFPKVANSYSGILIDPTNTFNTSRVPRIVGYVICTREVNPSNGNHPFIYIDFVELHRTLGQGLGLCTTMIEYMIAWLQTTYSYDSFKIYNASSNAEAARKCYLRAGLRRGLQPQYRLGSITGWNITAPNVTAHDIPHNPLVLINDETGRNIPINWQGTAHNWSGDESYLMFRNPIDVFPGYHVKVIVDNPTQGWGRANAESVGVVRQAYEDGSVEVDFPRHENWEGHETELEIVPAPAARGFRDGGAGWAGGRASHGRMSHHLRRF